MHSPGFGRVWWSLGLALHKKRLPFGGREKVIVSNSVQGKCYCRSYKHLLEMKEKRKKTKQTTEAACQLGSGGTGWACGMWCFWLVGQSEVMVFSYLPGFSGASVTFSCTSLGITKIKPNQPVNVRLLSYTEISAFRSSWEANPPWTWRVTSLPEILFSCLFFSPHCTVLL